MRLTGVGTIDQREVTVAFTGTPLEKVYDGTTNAAAALKRDVNYTLTGFVTGEGTDITLTGTSAFADKNVGPKAVTFDLG